MRAPVVERWKGRAGDLHAVVPSVPDGLVVVAMEVVGAALVLGSTQDPATVDVGRAARRGVEVVRRRSGGGAVLVRGGSVLWVDVLVPRGHRWWTDDVGASFLPIGRAWAGALEITGTDLGLPGVRVHEGMERTRWSDVVCFAGRGPGEVSAGGAKVVGISQRRTRDLARFQCAVLREWDPTGISELLQPSPPVSELAGLARGLGRQVSEPTLLAALVEAMS